MCGTWRSRRGVTAGDSIKEAAQQYAILYSVVAGKAQAEGYSYGREDKAAYQEELATAKEQLGGEEAYETYLKSMCISDSGFEKVSSVGVLYDHMLQGMFQEGKGGAATQEDLEKFAQDNDVLAATHPPADPGQPDRPGPVRGGGRPEEGQGGGVAGPAPGDFRPGPAGRKV
ncbi:MAG: hypothetical protein ACLSCQ_06595 [Evtepia gabavorous]